MKQFSISTIVAAAVAATILPAHSQLRIKPEDNKMLGVQAKTLADQLKPVVKDASKHTVSVRVGGRQLAYGTVTKHGILTKWSEVKGSLGELSVVNSSGVKAPAKAVGYYEEYDLVVLKAEGIKMDPYAYNDAVNPSLGSFLTMSGTNGSPAGFGALSVKPRSLREADRAFLGIQMDFRGVANKGVRIERIVEKTGAAKAGLKPNDFLLAIDGTKLTGAMETRNILQKLKPQQVIHVKFRRGEEEKETEVTLGSRPKLNQFPQDRLRRMQRMGGPISKIGSGFPNVIQSDMQITDKECGGPVVDLKGKPVGITIARGSRIKTFIIPWNSVDKLLQTDATPVQQPKVAERPAREVKGVLEGIDDIFSGGGDKEFERMLRGFFAEPQAGQRGAQPMDPEAIMRQMRQQMEQMQRRMEEMERMMRERQKQQR